MAVATGGRIGGVSGALARYLRYALSVAAGNAANLLTLARLFCAVPIVLLVRAGAYHQAGLLFLLTANISEGRPKMPLFLASGNVRKSPSASFCSRLSVLSRNAIVVSQV